MQANNQIIDVIVKEVLSRIDTEGRQTEIHIHGNVEGSNLLVGNENKAKNTISAKRRKKLLSDTITFLMYHAETLRSLTFAHSDTFLMTGNSVFFLNSLRCACDPGICFKLSRAENFVSNKNSQISAKTTLTPIHIEARMIWR